MFDDIIVTAVPATMVDLIWDKVAPHLRKAIAKAPNDLSLANFKAKLMEGSTVAIIASEDQDVLGINIVEVVEYSTGHKVLYISVTAGERMSEWMDKALGLAHAIARDFKCVELRGSACRKGWMKMLDGCDDQDWYNIHEVIGCKVKQIEEKT